MINLLIILVRISSNLTDLKILIYVQKFVLVHFKEFRTSFTKGSNQL